MRRRYAIGAVLVACASVAGGISVAASATPSSAPTTPNECILLNGGDYNACNVGNSGRGDLPFRPVPNGASDVSKAASVTSIVWGGPAADGGYRCLRDTGGASGQCDAAEGVTNSHHAVAGSTD